MAVSIVMLGGAGRAFGLDYWVMPYPEEAVEQDTVSRKNSTSSWMSPSSPASKWRDASPSRRTHPYNHE